ncbi:hypothetical protein A9Q79_03230 [Methylophaga sp. 42_25_T18]|nr:hypothetical protein A9Q79_03230 [Methylophaga sp. 42_25_T18]OUR88087.1 hypothetical protein A9Q92_03345 [Methylophaga sp. 42_8_T64]
MEKWEQRSLITFTRLWKQVAALLITFIILIFSVSFSFTSLTEVNYRAKLTDTRNSLVLELIEQLSIEALIIEDSISLRSNLNNLIRSLPEILFVEIKNENGEIIASVSRLLLDNNKQLISISNSIKFEEELFGYIHFKRDPSQDVIGLAHPLSQLHWNYVVFSSIILILTLIFLYFSLRPLFLKSINDSMHDSLTNIPNRKMFDEVANVQVAYAKRNRINIGLILIDIDFFKQFNDNYGHSKGDECLKQVARSLMSSAERESDVVARVGGEEFAIFISGNDCDVKTLAEKCRRNIEKLAQPHQFSACANVITISAGFVECVSSPHLKLSELYARADKALYRAKGNSRNSISQ